MDDTELQGYIDKGREVYFRRQAYNTKQESLRDTLRESFSDIALEILPKVLVPYVKKFEYESRMSPIPRGVWITIPGEYPRRIFVTFDYDHCDVLYYDVYCSSFYTAYYEDGKYTRYKKDELYLALYMAVERGGE